MTVLRHVQAFADYAGIELSAEALDQLDAYRSMLLEANQRFNLTRITDPTEFEQRILVESIALQVLIPWNATSLVDVGSGGGVPGLPIAIVRPDLRVVLADSTAKKVRFLNEVGESLGLDAVTAVHMRAEEMGRDNGHRDRYDVVTARAVARLATLAELTLPLAAVEGVVLLPKGADVADELDEAQYAIRMLGGRERPVITNLIDGTSVIAIDKRVATPTQFPRRTGIPNKQPLVGPGRSGAEAVS